MPILGRSVVGYGCTRCLANRSECVSTYPRSNRSVNRLKELAETFGLTLKWYPDFIPGSCNRLASRVKRASPFLAGNGP